MSEQADRLVALAHEVFELGVSHDAVAFVFEMDGPLIAHPISRSGELTKRLAALYYDRTDGDVPTSSALVDALTVLEGEALRMKPTRVYLRIAQVGETIFLDLGDPVGHTVEITASGWRILSRSPVLFRRSQLTGVLPLPEAGGSVDEWRPLLNCDDEQFRLLVGWGVSYFFERRQHPVLGFFGEHGVAKSTAAGMVVDVFDPSPARLSAPSPTNRDWAVHASGRQIIAVDNLTSISDSMADYLCRCVTGDAVAIRRLWTDGEVFLMAFRRSVIITGIAPPLRGDLADRTVRIVLAPIGSDRRMTQGAIADAFEKLRPRLLGAFLDMVVATLGRVDQVDVSDLPRMADHAQVLAALDLAFPGSGYLDSYVSSADRILVESIDDDEVAAAVRNFAAKEGVWWGTASSLYQHLLPRPPTRGWPKTPQHLSRRLREAAPGLRTVGVDIQWDREGAKGTRTIRIEYTEPSSGSSGPSVEVPGKVLVEAVADDPDDADDAVRDLPTIGTTREGALDGLKLPDESCEEMLQRRHDESQDESEEE